MVRRNKFLVFEYDKLRQSCLHWAIKRNNLKVLNYLIENGADVEFRDFSGRTPLQLALTYKLEPIVRYLLGMKVDPNS